MSPSPDHNLDKGGWWFSPRGYFCWQELPPLPVCTPRFETSAGRAKGWSGCSPNLHYWRLVHKRYEACESVLLLAFCWPKILMPPPYLMWAYSYLEIRRLVWEEIAVWSPHQLDLPPRSPSWHGSSFDNWAVLVMRVPILNVIIMVCLNMGVEVMEG